MCSAPLPVTPPSSWPTRRWPGRDPGRADADGGPGPDRRAVHRRCPALSEGQLHAGRRNGLLVQVKQNQPTLHERLARLRAEHHPFDSHETGGVARSIDWSRSSTQLDPEWQPLITCVARVSRLTFEKNTRSGLWPSREEIGCYACQIRLDADARAVRSHWGIENRDHYVRDVDEDDSRIRHRPGAMARIRSAALNILRAKGIQNVSQAPYVNALNFDQLLALGSS